MTTGKTRVTVCICTFKRPELLKRLLMELDRQDTGGLLTYSAVVADNDAAGSARQVVMEFAAQSSFPVTYCMEPLQNIALARNMALAHAKGDFIAFIDDDEYPSPNWLCDFIKTCGATGASGVLGPVMPYFEEKPPKWVTRGRFFERPTHETGYQVGLQDLRTSSVLLRREILDGMEMPFRAEFGTGGEDTDFFLRMMDKGYTFVWCNEAVVYEAIPPKRCTRRYLFRRSLHRGNISSKFSAGYLLRVVKSFLAVPAYGLALPFLFIAGDHLFIKYMIKLCDHSGMLLALFRITPFKEYK